MKKEYKRKRSLKGHRLGKVYSTGTNTMLYMCAYYYLKDAGWFPDAGKQFPSHTVIHDILIKESLLPDRTDMTEILDYLQIPYSHAVWNEWKRGRCKTEEQVKEKPIKVISTPKIRISKSANKIPSAEFFASDSWRAVRYRVLELHGATCQCCGRSRKAHGVILHVDHIHPRSIRPDLALDINNLQVLCEDCNLGKSNKFATDWR